MKQVFNPYLPSWEYIPDGEPHVFGNRLYIYGSHDAFAGKAYCEQDYTVWSAPVDDLTNWRCDGVAYRKSQDPDNAGGRKDKWIPDVVKESDGKYYRTLWAPDVCRGKDGRYYLYYCCAWSTWIGASRADKPEGPFEYYGRVHYADGTVYGKKKGDLPFDPGVLADDDGKTWLYSGFASGDRLTHHLLKMSYGITITGKNSFVMELDSDMLTIKSHKPLLPGCTAGKNNGFDGHEFYEASSIRKFNGKYYFIYSDALSHELSYAISDRPDGDFVYGEPLHSNGNLGYQGKQEADYPYGNNHGSIEFVNGRYYIFGHRQTNYGEYSRQGVAELIEMDSEGRFSQAEMTSCGLNGGPLTAKGTYPASICCVLKGTHGTPKITRMKKHTLYPMVTQESGNSQTESQYITNFYSGCIAGYKYFSFEGDETTISVTVRPTAGQKPSGKQSGIAEGTLKVYTTQDLTIPAAEIKIHCTDRYKEFAGNLNAQSGTHPIFFVYEGTGALDISNFTI